MGNTFIEEVVRDLIEEGYNLSELTFILPSKRAGTFLKKTIANQVQRSLFAPEIISIEEFVETLSELQYATNTELLFEFYEVYVNHSPKDSTEPFDKFSKWAQLLLQDFNEIDRYLIPPDHIFNYLSDIKDIEHWSVSEDQSEQVQNYLAFWKRLPLFYQEFQYALKQKRKGYQGLVYKEAVNNIEEFIAHHDKKTYVFAGFNALNKAEELIIQELLAQDLAKIYWDIDQRFLNNPVHDAGLFIRDYRKTWKHFNSNEFKWVGKHYDSKKHIEVIGAPKHISQVKYVGELLEKLILNHKSLEKTAIVLGDESLLIPLLNSIPRSIQNINVTMGLPLKQVPIAALFESLFSMQRRSSKSIYYKDALTVLSNPFIVPLFQTETTNYATALIDHIQKNNIIYASITDIISIAPDHEHELKLLFKSWNDNPVEALSCIQQLIGSIQLDLNKDKDKNKLGLEQLYRFYQLFNTLGTLNTSFAHINSIAVLLALYRELISSETLDFQGEPLQGLQIMGMLESRVLDFETVIITSLNEGVLPAGKSVNSFIPFDVKFENELPTYKEKDAVYTYHFYRLIQRAKDIYLLYNTEPDVLKGGEKSRFITQLEVDGHHKINQYTLTPDIPTLSKTEKHFKKPPMVMAKLMALAAKGFSPSSLTNYIRNPIDFYYEKVLDIKQFEDVEESVALNTLGTVIHNTLEDFYKPFEDKFLTVKDVQQMIGNIDKTITEHFAITYKDGDLSRGKNLITLEIAKRYVLNFLNLEIRELQEGNQIKIIEVEAEQNVPIQIDGIDQTIYLTGKVDRIDSYNGTTRIIDYKTGKVDRGKVEIVDWADITTDYTKFSKSFQILMYSYMMHVSNRIELPVEAGIISFKNLSSGLLRFATKPSSNSRTRSHVIDENTLLNFEEELKQLISEILNPDIDFIEKDIE